VELVVENVEKTKFIDILSSLQEDTEYDYEIKKLLGKNLSKVNFHYDVEEEDQNKKMIKSETTNVLSKVNLCEL
jgi:hypothetical protein